MDGTTWTLDLTSHVMLALTQLSFVLCLCAVCVCMCKCTSVKVWGWCQKSPLFNEAGSLFSLQLANVARTAQEILSLLWPDLYVSCHVCHLRFAWVLKMGTLVFMFKQQAYPSPLATTYVYVLWWLDLGLSYHVHQVGPTSYSSRGFMQHASPLHLTCHNRLYSWMAAVKSLSSSGSVLRGFSLVILPHLDATGHSLAPKRLGTPLDLVISRHLLHRGFIWNS